MTSGHSNIIFNIDERLRYANKPSQLLHELREVLFICKEKSSKPQVENASQSHRKDSSAGELSSKSETKYIQNSTKAKLPNLPILLSASFWSTCLTRTGCEPSYPNSLIISAYFKDSLKNCTQRERLKENPVSLTAPFRIEGYNQYNFFISLVKEVKERDMLAADDPEKRIYLYAADLSAH